MKGCCRDVPAAVSEHMMGEDLVRGGSVQTYNTATHWQWHTDSDTASVE